MDPSWNEVLALVISLRNELLANPRVGLTVESRNRLLGALGEPVFDETKEPKRPHRTPGLLRRLRLSELCFERVYPIWLQHVRTTHPVDAVNAAHDYLDGKVSWEDAWRARNRFLGRLQYVYELPKEIFHAAYAGFAATGAAAIPLFDDWHLAFTPDEEREDSWDPYVCSAAAYSGGFPSDEGFQTERYQEFWLWMLDDAVPIAWNTSDRWWLPV